MTGWLTLLTAPDCHLCGHGRKVLDELEADGVVRWREVSTESEEGAALAVTAPPLRPVLFCGDRVLGYGRLSARRLRKTLAGAGSPPPLRRELSRGASGARRRP